MSEAPWEHGTKDVVCQSCGAKRKAEAATGVMAQPGYEPLAEVLIKALRQSDSGKGRDRHATAGKPFLSQPICEIGRMVGIGYNVGQAMKKGQEAMRLPTERAQAELLGAIVYMASAYLLLGESTEVTDGKV